jgi:hypothetical protein
MGLVPSLPSLLIITKSVHDSYYSIRVILLIDAFSSRKLGANDGNGTRKDGSRPFQEEQVNAKFFMILFFQEKGLDYFHRTMVGLRWTDGWSGLASKKNWLADFALFSLLLGRLRLANEEKKQRDLDGEAVVGGPSSELPGLSILKESHNPPQRPQEHEGGD